MTELRKDPIVGRWVIISVEQGQEADGPYISFHRGSRYAASARSVMAMSIRPRLEIWHSGLRAPRPDSPGWTFESCTESKFPCASDTWRIEQDRGRKDLTRLSEPELHEVAIETPEHNPSLATMPLKAVEDALWAYHMRLNDLKKDRDSGTS